jgi:hypothetical protein
LTSAGIHRELKRLGFDDAWIRYRGGSYETAETIGKYKVEFEVQASGDLQCIIWNPETPCITIYIHMESRTAVLSALKYSPKCTIDGTMKRGEGTREMLAAAFDIAKARGADRVQLHDESTITCESGETIKLGAFSFIRTGMTWYEKHFGFKPLPEFQEEYDVAKQLRKSLPLTELRGKPCSYFDRKTTARILRELDLDFGEIVWEKSL